MAGTGKPPAISVDTEQGLIRVGDLEFDTETLLAMADPDARVLWAFIRSKDGKRIQPVAYDERKVIWIEASDLERGEQLE